MELQEDGVDLFESGLGLAAGGFDEEAEAEFLGDAEGAFGAAWNPLFKNTDPKSCEFCQKNPQSPSAESLPFPPFP